jgi:uncharacterized protein YqeY
MTFVEKLNQDIAEAMRAKDQDRLGPLRMLKAALMNKKVERGKDVTDGEALAIVSTLVKQRKDSVEQFTNAGRQDLADKEKAEITILEAYLPPPVSREELEKAVDEAVRTTGASSPKDMGGVMKAVMAGLAGRNADGKLINELVRARLSR